MATRFRLPSSGAADVSPAFQTYTHTNTIRRRMPSTAQGDSSALTNENYAPDAADHAVAGDACIAQFVSDPMEAGITFSAFTPTYAMCAQFAEDHANNQLSMRYWAGIYSEDGTTLRVELRSKIGDFVEMANSMSSIHHSTTATNSSNYTTVAGDRLVVEISANGTPGGGGGVQGHNFSLRTGSNGASGDLAASDAQTATDLNGWFETSVDITFQSTGTTVTPSPVSATFTATTPTVVAGQVTATPSPIGASFTATTPVLSAVRTATPSPVVAAFTAPTPSIGLGSRTLTPASVVAAFSATNPTLSSARVLTPSPTVSAFSVLTPTVIVQALVRRLAVFLYFGKRVKKRLAHRRRSQGLHISVAYQTGTSSQVVTPSPVVASFAATTPTVVRGNRTLAPGSVSALLSTTTPAVLPGVRVVTPTPVTLTLSATTPALTTGSVKNPESIVVQFSNPTPLLIAGGVNVSPSPVVVSLTATTPAIALRSFPAPVVAAFLTTTPGVLSVRTITPGAVVASFTTPTPEIIRGLRALSPNPVSLGFVTPTPSVLISEVISAKRLVVGGKGTQFKVSGSGQQERRVRD